MRRKHRGVFERPRGVYWINYHDANGVRRRERIGFRFDEAVAAYHDRKRRIREGLYTPPRSAGRIFTFRELAHEALESKKHRVKPRSYKADSQRLGVLLPSIGSLPANSFTPAAIQKIFDELRAGGRKGPTVNRYRSLLSSIFKHGVQNGKVASNPVRDVKRYKESGHRVRWMKLDEETKLRAALPADRPDLQAELDLAVNTGMRRGELFNVRWNDVDRQNKLLYCDGKTGRSEVLLNGKALEALDELEKRSRGCVGIIRESTCDGKRDWRRWFEDAVKAAGIQERLCYHDLRHTYASRLVMAGVDIRTVCKLMRHGSIGMTMRYAHLSPDHTRAAAEKI